MSIFLRPKIRLKWGCWRSLEVNCANFVAKVKFGNSFKYNILSSLKSEVALRSLKAAWGDVWEFFSRLIVQIFCMACSLHAISLMSIILRPRSVQMLRSLEVTSDHLLLTSNFCSLRIVEGGLYSWKLLHQKSHLQRYRQKVSSLFTSYKVVHMSWRRKKIFQALSRKSLLGRSINQIACDWCQIIGNWGQKTQIRPPF